jgi:hypothetical protein
MTIAGSTNGTQTNYQMPFEARFGNNYITPKGDGWVTSMRNTPSSTVYNGYTYQVFQGPKTTGDGDPYITRMNNTTGVWDTPVKVGVNNAGVGDLIATPVVLVRTDGGKAGKILVVWGGDSGAGHLRDIQWSESTYAENITAWGTAASVGFTDGQWYNLFQAATGDIYIHAFSTTTGQYKRVSRKMVSGGSTWGTQTTIYDLTGITRDVHAGQPAYDSVNGIFWFPVVAGNVLVATHYHYLWVVGFKPSDGKFYDVAGNGITPTLTSSNLTNAAYKYQIFVWDGVNQRTLDEPSIALDSNGYPHVSYEYSEDVGNTVWAERYVSWNGSAWSSPNTVTGGVGGITGQIFWNAVNDLDIIGASTSIGANKDFLKYHWNGSNWTTSYILTNESMPDTLQFNNVNKVESYTSNFKVTFANWDTGSTRTNQRLYGYGDAGIVQFKGPGFLMMNGNGQTDFGDVRFTNSTGNETLAYWTESEHDSQYMSGIVKIDSIAGSPTSTTVYGYYGNVAASASSNPNGTFAQFDNFERGNNGDAIGGNWTGVTGNVSINTSIFNGGTRSGRWTTGGTNGLAAIPYTANNATDILVYIYKTNAAAFNLAHGDDSHTIYIQITSAEDVTYYNGASFIDTGLNISPDTWQTINVDNVTWGNPTTYTITINGLLSASASTTYISNDADNALRFDTSVGHLYVDDLFVSKEVSPEPVWLSSGDEESSAPPTVTTQAVSSIGLTTAIANGTITATNGGNATSVFVQYGTISGNYTANFTESGNYGAAAFTVNMTGLSAGTTYYARVGAANSFGTGYGGEVNFNTTSTGNGIFNPATGIGISANVTVAVVPDNANPYVWMVGNSMSYANYLKIIVNGVEKLWYQPVAIISGTILPDRDGTKDGDITWGANPSGVSASFGALTSTTVVTTNTTSTGYVGSFLGDNVSAGTSPTLNDAQTAVQSDWLYLFIKPFADTSGTQAVWFYWFGTILAAIVGFVFAYRTKHLLIAAIAFDIPFGYGITKGYIPEWVIIVLVLWTIGAVVQEARM